APRGRQRRLPLLLRAAQERPAPGLRPRPGQEQEQREPGLLHPVRARPRVLGDAAVGRGRVRPARGRPVAAVRRARAGAVRPSRRLRGTGAECGRGLRAAPDRVLPQGSGRRLPRLVQRRAHARRRRGAQARAPGAGRGGTPGAAERSGAARRVRARVDVRTPEGPMARDAKPRRTPRRLTASSPRKGSGVITGLLVGLALGAILAAGSAWLLTRSSPFQTPHQVAAPIGVNAEPIALPGKPGDRPVTATRDFDFYTVLPRGEGAALPPPATT